jgi:hypothetical protein
MLQWNASHSVAHINRNYKKTCFLWGPPKRLHREGEPMGALSSEIGSGSAGRQSWALARRPLADQCSLESAVSESSSQAARTPGIALVRRL